MGKFDKKEKCEYCEERMEAVYRNKRFCSPKCRVYFNREKEKPKETPKPIIKKEPSKGDLLKLIRDGKI